MTEPTIPIELTKDELRWPADVLSLNLNPGPWRVAAALQARGGQA